MRSESTSAFGQPSETKLTRGALIVIPYELGKLRAPYHNKGAEVKIGWRFCGVAAV
ncbi:predicted protein [Brucella suis bv. 3 str. 686]|nr:predicted protein [Brucella suis bv. 3 str. 686]EEZ16541.1 predicted protein [Brucella melitensis bv. 2 str. 63/9]